MSEWKSFRCLPETHPEESCVGRDDDYYCSNPVLAYLAEPFEGSLFVVAIYDQGICEHIRYGWSEIITGEEIRPIAWMPLPNPPQSKRQKSGKTVEN